MGSLCCKVTVEENEEPTDEFKEYTPIVRSYTSVIQRIWSENGYDHQHPLLANILLYDTLLAEKLENSRLGDTMVDMKENTDYWSTVRRFMDYAQLAYKLTSDTDTETVTKRLIEKIGLTSSRDVLHVDLPSEDAFTASYFVVKDFARDEFVVSIQGTSDFGDIMSDLNACQVSFLGGEAHDGMVRAANYVLEGIRPLLYEHSDEDMKLVVVGHSLGAGIAHLLSGLIMESELQKMCDGMAVYAFAPPPTFKGTFPDSSDTEIFSFVNQDDAVPRLSLYNFAEFANRLRALDSMEWDTTERQRIIEGDTAEKNILQMKYLPGYFPKSTDSNAIDTSKWTDFRMPGKIFHFLIEQAPKTATGAREAQPEEFNSIPVTPTCISNHKVEQYIGTLDQLILASELREHIPSERHSAVHSQTFLEELGCHISCSIPTCTS